MKNKKILVPIFFRGHLARLRSVFRAIERHPALELQIMAASRAAYGSFLANFRHSEPRSWRKALPWYIKAIGANDVLEKKVLAEGFPVHARVPLFLDGGTSATMAKSVGIGMVRIIDELQRLKPDIVFVNADRFEMMAVALAAAYLNIPIAHHEGGDISGTIDESVRHAITKFAHIHLTATEESKRRVLQMGENPRFVFNVGSPTIDAIKSLDLKISNDILPGFDWSRPYLLVMAHPVTTESDEENLKTVRSIIAVMERLQMPTVLIGGNSDAYSRIVGPAVAEWVERTHPHPSHRSYLFATKLMQPDNYLRVLAHAACAVGNSSSFIREAAYLGTPAVLVGSRQQGRERGENAIEIEADAAKIEAAVRRQLAYGRYPQDSLFGDGTAGAKIAEILATANPPIQKKFHEL